MVRKLHNHDTFLDDTFASYDSIALSNTSAIDAEIAYLSEPAPNIIEWVTGINYWNVPSTFGHVRQYQIMRDAFMLRCPICNSMKPEAVDCWGKGRDYLESEVLLTWSKEHQEFVCPKCKSTQHELIDDGLFNQYNAMIILAGMRSGKSYLGGHIGGYFEHMLITWGMKGKGSLQRMLQQEKSEWFEVTFAASTATQAQQTIYAKYREMRNGSPWLNRYVNWVTSAEKGQVAGGSDKWKYKKNDDSIQDGWLQVRFNRIASDSAGVAGKTRIMASIDEWARLINSEGTRSALELYRVMNQSLKTVRAAVNLNKLPPFLGMMVNVTSPIAQDDPAMTTYNLARDGEIPTCYGWKGATWEFNPFMPRSEFDDDYRRDPVGAERDFGSNPPLASTPYIDDPARFWNCIDWDTKPLVSYKRTYKTDATGLKYVASVVDECRIDPNNSYYIFADAGVKWDSFSVVIARPEWVKSVETLDEEAVDTLSAIRDIHSGDNVPSGFISPQAAGMEILPGDIDGSRSQFLAESQARGAFSDRGEGGVLITKIVSVLRIVPTNERQIWFEAIVDIIKYLKQRIRIVDFACDNWNSISTIQAIRNMGIPSREITLRIEDFMQFRNLAYNHRVSMLPPAESDRLKLLPSGHLSMGLSQPEMSGEGIALVELLKLNRSEDLKRVYNEHKGNVRGQDSDDVARCIIGANKLVQGSVVDSKANNNANHQTLQRLNTLDNPMSGQVYRRKG